MNYFAHGRNYIDEPYFMAGTAVPDWLSAIDRRVRSRSNLAEPFTEHQDERLAALAKGIMQHHFDDAWFHATRAFAELNYDFTVRVRDALPKDDGFRPSFLGHILVELLLDDELIQRDPPRLDAYYDAMNSLDADFLATSINRMTTKTSDRIRKFIPMFWSERFLYDYADDAKLLYRLNRVMRRVGLPELPTAILTVFPQARLAVRERADELLTPPKKDERPK